MLHEIGEYFGLWSKSIGNKKGRSRYVCMKPRLEQAWADFKAQVQPLIDSKKAELVQFDLTKLNPMSESTEPEEPKTPEPKLDKQPDETKEASPQPKPHIQAEEKVDDLEESKESDCDISDWELENYIKHKLIKEHEAV